MVRALVFTSFLMLGQFTVIPFIAPYMVANVGFTEGELTYIYFMGGALTILTSPLVGWLSDKFGKIQVFTLFGRLVKLFVQVQSSFLEDWQQCVTGVASV